MSIIVIPRDITEEELKAKAKELQPPKEPKPRSPRGWEVYWANREPTIPYDPPPLITPEELRAFRESKGWFQKHLAIRTGYSLQAIKYMENGKSGISSMFSSTIQALKEVDALKAENESLKAENERLKASREPA